MSATACQAYLTAPQPLKTRVNHIETNMLNRFLTLTNDTYKIQGYSELISAACQNDAPKT